MLAGHLALTAAALFSGAAFYINIAEQPARLGLSDQALLDQWKPSYKRGFAMQSTLAVGGFLLGGLAWWQSSELFWVVGAILMLANWPYTLIGIMPTNGKLMATQTATPDSRILIVKWGGLHAVRTVLGILATAAFLLAGQQQ
jgi:hypothetical protein